MVSVWIDGQERDGIDEGWIARNVEGARRAGKAVCVRIAIKGGGLDLLVTAGVCPGGAGGRAPTAREQQILERWSRCGLSGVAEFDPGHLIRCLKEIERET